MPQHWVDFAFVKRRARFEAVLDAYGMDLIGRGPQRFILCPFHSESAPSCSIHLDRLIFHCFGCPAKGTVIDFVARLDRIDLRAAATKVAEICGIDLAASDAGAAIQATAHATECEHRAPDCRDPNRPLSGTLALDPRHPYLATRHLTPELVKVFGIGYCDRGPMRGRICIPIHDAERNLVAYAGRWPSDEIPKGVGRYIFSRGFQKRRVLFNLNRVAISDHIVLVEGYWSVFRLHGMAVPVAGLMGSSISPEQIAILSNRGTRFVTLLMDGDEPGRRARDRIVPMLANTLFVRAPLLPKGEKPDTYEQVKLLELTSFC